MCTVSFLPVNSSSFILTHNRDEHVERGLADLPQLVNINNQQLIFPKDTKAHGTWIATSKNFSLCLLNGGFEKHKHNPPYKHSRGQLILDFFNFNDVEKFISSADFNNIEAFTLIIIKHKNNQVVEYVWTGEALFSSKKNNDVPHLWCSSTLYDKELKEKRLSWFENFIAENKTISQKEIINFHLSQPNNNEEGIKINRNEVLKTVSLTSIEKKDEKISMHYQDLIEEKNQLLIL